MVCDSKPIFGKRDVKPVKMSMLELLDHLCAGVWTTERCRSEEEPRAYRVGEPKIWYLKGNICRWYLVALAMAQELRDQPDPHKVECIRHLQRARYYKALTDLVFFFRKH